MKGWRIKLAVSLLVRAFDVIGERAARLAGRASPGTAVVLFYHEVTQEQVTAFSRQMDELLERAIPIALTRGEALVPDRHHAAVTFDDGFARTLARVLPELERREIPLAVFVPTGFLGGRPEYVRGPGGTKDRETVLSRDEIASLGRSRLVTIGSHGVSHRPLTSLDPREAEAELRASRATLEEILGREVRLFSFPFGAHDRRHLEQARQAGYERVFSIEPYPAFNRPGEYLCGRVCVEPTDSPLVFRLKLAGCYRWLPAASRLKSVLLGPRGPMGHPTASALAAASAVSREKPAR